MPQNNPFWGIRSFFNITQHPLFKHLRTTRHPAFYASEYIMIRSLTAISMILALPITAGAAPVTPAEKPTTSEDAAQKEVTQADPTTAVIQKKPLVKKISADVYQIGTITLNKKTREISLPAHPNIVEAGTPLEFLLVHLNGEKVHESLLITEADPTNLNIALKLLSYKESQELFRPITEDGSRGELYQKEPDNIRKAARFTIHVTWKEGEKAKSAPITQWLKHRITNKSMPDTPWVYNGSYVHNKVFKAKLNGNFLAIFPNESAIANFPGANGVDRYDDTLWISAPNLPREGSKITLTLKPWLGKLAPQPLKDPEPPKDPNQL